MKIIKTILTLLFVLFAYWQFNDPDALIWILMYLSMALLSLVSIFRRLNSRIILALVVFLIIVLAIYLPWVIDWAKDGMPSIADEMKASSPYIERVREFFGILICLASLIYHYFSSCKEKA